MGEFWVRLAKKNPTRASRILKKVIFGSPMTEFTDPPPLQAFLFYIPRAESYKKKKTPLFLRHIIWYTFRNRWGSGGPPPSKNLDTAQISEKSWELPNFWAPDQNPVSPRSGWTSRGVWTKIKNRFFTCKTRIDQKGPLFSTIFDSRAPPWPSRGPFRPRKWSILIPNIWKSQSPIFQKNFGSNKIFG